MSERLKALADAGVSIWLDDLSRERITSGNLADLVSNNSVSGVTTNPTIFAAKSAAITLPVPPPNSRSKWGSRRSASIRSRT